MFYRQMIAVYVWIVYLTILTHDECLLLLISWANTIPSTFPMSVLVNPHYLPWYQYLDLKFPILLFALCYLAIEPSAQTLEMLTTTPSSLWKSSTYVNKNDSNEKRNMLPIYSVNGSFLIAIIYGRIDGPFEVDTSTTASGHDQHMAMLFVCKDLLKSLSPLLD